MVMRRTTVEDGKILWRWPEGALVYHIYPRSFQDSNGDGIGDLPGIISRLDYLQSLSVTALWLSPFYPSPMADFGYDVADYCGVDPMFGTIADFKKLMTEAHRRDIKVMIDLVPNHTSDEHEWFKKSAASKDNTYHDWYIWRNAVYHEGNPDPQPPNNWRDALTGGPAWEWNETRQQFYLHSFDVRQPDLNWSNHAVREAIRNAMRFWLDHGVDGFRVDAVYWMAKEPLLSDDPANPDYVQGEDLLYEALKHENSRGWPAVYAYLSEMAEVLHEPAYQAQQRFMVTEAYPEGHNPLVEYLNFYVGMDPKVAAPFNFEGLGLPWKAAPWRKFLKAFHSALHQIDPHCVPSYAFGNHDQPRIATRIGEASARSAAVLLLTLPGMVFLYYGDELGMKNVVIPPEFLQDPAALADVRKGGGTHGQGRDPERTPMQWSALPNAGFTSASQSWLPLAPDYSKRNVEAQEADPHSLLRLYQQLAAFRAEHETLKHGGIHVLDVDCPNILGFVRERVADAPPEDSADYVILVNFSNETSSCTPEVKLGPLLISSHGVHHRPPRAAAIGDDTAAPVPSVTLRAHEAVIYQVA